MLRQKRIVKQPIQFTSLYPEPRSLTKANQKKNRKLNRCEFKEIPNPSKFLYNFKTFRLYGDIALIEKNGFVSTEVSIFNKFKFFRDIEITQSSATKLVRISPEIKGEPKVTPWTEVVEKLESYQTLESNNWARIINNFSLQYEKFLKELQERNYKMAKNEEEEKEYQRITEETKKKRSQLLEFFPCIYLKSQLTNSNIQYEEIAFNELFLRDLGYSIDSFVTAVFEAGIPQVSTYEAEANVCTAKALLENYFRVGSEGLVTPEYKFPLIMKSSYVKNTLAQTHFLMNYENGSFGIDIIVVLTHREEPNLDKRVLPKKIVNKEFVQDMKDNEKALSDFLMRYYDTSFTLRYTNFGKVCSIKEVPAVKEENSIYKQ